MVVRHAGPIELRYSVNAAAGVTSTTQIAVPAGFTIHAAVGADSFAFAGGVATMTVNHASTRYIILHLKAVGEPFDEFRHMWADLFQLITVMMSMSLIYALLGGDLSGNDFLGNMIRLVAGTAVVFILLEVVQRLR